jgi:hypothetical protein
MKNDNYDVSKALLESIRSKKNILTEEEKKDSIAITNDPKFGSNVLQNQIDSFKQIVNNGAKFADENSENPESNPLVYFPKTGNLVFSGSIPSLSGLRFQYSLNDVTASPYIFVDGLALTEDVITTLNKMRGHYLNWRDEFLEAGDLLAKLK